jgi:hypothetical protein
MRATLFALFLALGTAFAQDQPPPDAPKPAATGTLRVSVKIESSVDKSAEAVQGIQYNTWERLTHFGIRVDSLLPVGHPKLDPYVAGKAKAWEEKEPNAAPASLVIEGSQACEYNDANFFGQGQAHNYKGKLTVTVKTPEGETLATFDWEHTWGRLPTNYTKSQVQKEYMDMLATSLVLGLLKLEQVRSRVPADKKGDLEKWEAKERKRIFEPLKSNMSESPLAKFLKTLMTKEELEALEKEKKEKGEGEGEGDKKGK